MITVRRTAEFAKWLAALEAADVRAAARVARRLLRVRQGNLGDTKPVGEGVSELRIYFVRRGLEVVLLLCGGDKSSQDRDIRRAKALAKEV